MENVVNWAAQNFNLVLLIVIISYIIGIILLLGSLIRFNKLSRIYKTLTRGAHNKNLEEIIWSQSRLLEMTQEKVKQFEERLAEAENLAAQSIHKVSLVRFNAFHDVGGDLSFALALLNQQGDGLVISSIYGREDARVYAKALKKGQAQSQLSNEEQKAILNAMQNKGS
jgi:hypothetical protein